MTHHVNMFIIKVLLLFMLEKCASQQYLPQTIPDLCSSGSVDSASRISLSDGSHKYFISSGHNFWLLNITGELPNENNAQHFPYNFKPDVALIKDTTGCSIDGRRTLLLLEVRFLSFFIIRFVFNCDFLCR